MHQNLRNMSWKFDKILNFVKVISEKKKRVSEKKK